MPISRSDAARRMYGATEKPTAPAAAVTSRQAAANTLYRSGNTGGSIDTALSSCFGRLRGGITDKETLERLDEQRLQVGKLLREKHVDPADAQKLLGIYTEHKLHKRSPEALEKRWTGPAGYAEVRREAASDEAAHAALARTEAVIATVAKASPSFARDLVQSGATQDADFIKTAARIAAPPVNKGS